MSFLNVVYIVSLMLPLQGRNMQLQQRVLKYSYVKGFYFTFYLFNWSYDNTTECKILQNLKKNLWEQKVDETKSQLRSVHICSNVQSVTTGLEMERNMVLDEPTLKRENFAGGYTLPSTLNYGINCQSGNSITLGVL